MIYPDSIPDLILSFSVMAIAISIAFAVWKFFQYNMRVQENLALIRDREFFSAYESLREQMEARIAEMSHQLIDTREEFQKVNHLLWESQRAEREISQKIEESKNFNFVESLGVGDASIDEKMIFVLTPFSERERLTFSAIVESFIGFDVKVLRGDEENKKDILGHIVGLIVRSRIVIANISSRNPNVMYELGIAHALGKPVIMISSSKDTDTVFDLRNQTIIFFRSRAELVEKLRTEIARRFFSEN